MALLGTVSALRAQIVATPQMAVALDYLAQVFDPASPEHARVMAVPAGEAQRIDLAPGVFALEQAYVAKPREEGRYEAHDRHIDLQGIVSGPERMECCDRAQVAVTEDDLANRDVCFLADEGLRSVFTVQNGEVAVFFPSDAHMPSLAVEPGQVIQKTVVKVEVA